jgi:hypothetical protein
MIEATGSSRPWSTVRSVKEMPVDHEKPRWKTVEVDLAKFEGQEVTVRLEAHASGWAWEFAYWGGITLE